MVKIDQIFKLAFFSFLCPLGSRRVVKLPWELILSVNNALSKNVLFNSHPNFIFCGLFLCPWSVGRPQKCLRGHFQTHLFHWKLLKEYLYLVQKSTFFQGVSPGFLLKIDQIVKFAFCTCLCPWGSRRVVKLPWQSILSVNNALTKIFLFNSHPDFIFCGLFHCPWYLGRPQKCLRGPFQTHLFDLKLLKEYLYLVQKSTFFQGVSPGFLVKIDQIFKLAFFTCLCL